MVFLKDTDNSSLNTPNFSKNVALCPRFSIYAVMCCVKLNKMFSILFFQKFDFVIKRCNKLSTFLHSNTTP